MRSVFKQKSRRGFGKVLAVALLAVVALSWAVPVTAQSLFDDLPRTNDDLYDNNLYVKWSQGSSTKDEFRFWGPETLRTTSGQRVANTVLAVFGISPAESSVGPYIATDEYDADPPQLSGSVSRHLLNKGTEWKVTIGAASLVAAAREAGFSSMSLELCPLAAADVQSIDAFSDEEGCKSWTWSTSERLTDANAITISEHPDTANFENVVKQLAIWVAVISVITTGFAVLLQKLAMKELKTPNIVLSILSIVAGTVAVTIAACVFGWGVRSVHDVLLVEEAGYAKHALLIFLPSMLVSLPFVLPAIAFIWAKPRSVQIAGASSGVAMPVGPKTTVPDWMVGSQQPSQPRPSQPPVPPQAPPPQPMPPGVQPPPFVQPEPDPEQPVQPPRWDPPA